MKEDGKKRKKRKGEELKKEERKNSFHMMGLNVDIVDVGWRDRGACVVNGRASSEWMSCRCRCRCRYTGVGVAWSAFVVCLFVACNPNTYIHTYIEVLSVWIDVCMDRCMDVCMGDGSLE